MKTIKLKVPFTLVTKDFKGYESVELTVTTTIPEEFKIANDPEFKVQIPDYIFNELADTEPQFDTVADINKGFRGTINGCFSERDITRKFKKTQTAKLISTLKSYLGELSDIIVKRHSLETATKKKKLFIKFNHSRNHHTNGLNNAYRGETISQSFNYFIGYEVWTESHSIHFGNDEPQKKYITHIGYASPTASIQH
jgi:hypothetical protein